MGSPFYATHLQRRQVCASAGRGFEGAPCHPVTREDAAIRAVSPINEKAWTLNLQARSDGSLRLAGGACGWQNRSEERLYSRSSLLEVRIRNHATTFNTPNFAGLVFLLRDAVRDQATVCTGVGRGQWYRSCRPSRSFEIHNAPPRGKQAFQACFRYRSSLVSAMQETRYGNAEDTTILNPSSAGSPLS